MADEPEEDVVEADETAEPEEQSEEQPAGKKRFNISRKKFLMFGLPLLLLAGGGGYFGMSYLPVLTEGEKTSAQAVSKVYYDLPEMVVNLSSGDKRVQYLKLKVALEANDQLVINSLTPVMPRILDMFQLYLRELRSSDLEGSAGIFRLKEELLRRINLEIHPNQVDRVLFKEIIVQ
jgi:flagellar FliL protein